MFQFNRITRVLREKEGEPSPSVSQQEFNPTVIEQGVGLLDMRETAEQQEQQQEETGSVSEEESSTVEDKDKEGKQSGDKTAIVDDKSAKELSKDVEEEDNGGDNKETTTSDAEYTYQGVAVDVTNTPEMEESFKEKGLDINAVNKEIYSEKGLTEETRAKLDEAFGKMSVGMYLQGLEKQNDAMLATHKLETDKANENFDAMSTEATGGKFKEVMKWANDNLSKDDYAAYAANVNGDNALNMKLALEDLTRRSGIGGLEPPAVIKSAKLIEANNSEKAAPSAGISGAEYREAITSGEYTKDMKSWDAKRQMGIDAGIGHNY